MFAADAVGVSPTTPTAIISIDARVFKGMLCRLHLTGKARKTRAIDANTKFSRTGSVGMLRANELDKSVGESRLRVAQRLSVVCE